MKHTAAEGKVAVAYYVDENGNRTRIAEQHYDAEKGEMTMVLDHFSIYAIVDEEPSSDEGIPIIVIVMMSIFAILDALILIVAFLYVRGS